MTDQQELTMAHQKPVEPIGPTGDTIAICISTASTEQLFSACVALQSEIIRRSWAETLPTKPTKTSIFVSVEPVL